MSGGVDSSVSAAILSKQGFDCVGLFMKNWSDDPETDSVCQWERDLEDVRSVCEKFGMPWYTVNFEEEYKQNVFSVFLEELKAGRTPNPDILCNREIKFQKLIEIAKGLGASKLATGHYARVVTDKKGDVHLFKGKDGSKDQSYFLSSLTVDQLGSALFPLGKMTKREVRSLAMTHELPNASKEESFGICFIGQRPMKEFLSNFLPTQRGDIVDTDGVFMGNHDGVWFYTIGQRRGLRVSGGMPYYIVGKDVNTNTLIVAKQIEEEKMLFHSTLLCNTVHWIQNPKTKCFTCSAKIRYRQPDQPCGVEIRQNGVLAHFKESQRAMTEGQVIVFYRDDEVLGSGIIDQVRGRQFSFSRFHNDRDCSKI